MVWVKIWSSLFFVSLGLFACLSIVVGIGGFFNVLSLLKDLATARTDRPETHDEAPGVG